MIQSSIKVSRPHDFHGVYSVEFDESLIRIFSSLLSLGIPIHASAVFNAIGQPLILDDQLSTSRS
jgi:hypothetical protein